MQDQAPDARHTQQIEAHGLQALVLRGGGCKARVYLQGAHVTSFSTPDHGELLWVSREAIYAEGKPIRGGVPLCFPWFGGHHCRPELPPHGFARTRAFQLESSVAEGAGVVATLRLSADAETERSFPKAFVARLRVSVGVNGPRLGLAWEVENTGSSELEYEVALHTYLGVSDVRQLQVHGLEGTRYDDKVTGSRGLVESGQALTFSGETDRVYGSAAKVIVTDPGLRRRIVVEKRGSLSTVVWNPWSDRAKHMVDFGDDEWPRMLCVEAANTRPQQVRLAAGKRHVTETCIFAQST